MILVPLGAAIKSSLMMQFSRENSFEYLSIGSEASPEDITQQVIQHSKSKRLVLDGVAPSLQILIQLEVKLNPDRLVVVQFGPSDSAEDKAIAQYYERLARLKRVQCVESVNETYRNLRRVTAPKVVFIFGPPLALKSEIARTVAQVLGYQYVDFGQLRANVLKEQDGVVLANKFIKLAMHSGRNLVVDGFFDRSQELTVLEEYLLPHRVLLIKPTKDEVDSKIKALKSPELRKAKAAELEAYTGF